MHHSLQNYWSKTPNAPCPPLGIFHSYFSPPPARAIPCGSQSFGWGAVIFRPRLRNFEFHGISYGVPLLHSSSSSRLWRDERTVLPSYPHFPRSHLWAPQLRRRGKGRAYQLVWPLGVGGNSWLPRARQVSRHLGKPSSAELRMISVLTVGDMARTYMIRAEF